MATVFSPNVNGLDRDLVTILVPARNEEEFIGPCLDSILAQTEQALQVVVVDGASTDRTPEIVREYARHDPRVELAFNPEAIIPKSLNVGLAAARGQWLVRVDAHSRVPPGYVRKALQHLRTGDWGGVGGRKDGRGVTDAGRAIAAAMGSRFGVGNSLYHYGESLASVEHIPFGAYSTALLQELGGWDERLPANEDFELDYRLRASGHNLLFDPEIVIEWQCRQAVPDLFRQYRRYGRGKADVARLHLDSLRLRHLAAPALVASWVLALPLAVLKPRLAALAIAPYVAGLTAATIVTARRVSSRPAKAWVAPAFAAMHAGWGLGFWEGLGRNPHGLPRLLACLGRTGPQKLPKKEQ